jgi:L-seryl-tRNA(Ser) seleniumtransferase
MPDQSLKNLPSVSEILKAVPEDIPLHEAYLTRLIQRGIAMYRKQAREGKLTLSREGIKQRVLERVKQAAAPSLTQVINGTGIVLHTGFGRAPIHGTVLRRVVRRLEGYVNLEFDLPTGKRGDRLVHLQELLAAITGAESNIVVNNNAAAVFLTLNTLAEGKEVIVSRGQQVEIGGSFRIPDIIRKSHCLLKEVGTTNRTHLWDYEQAIGPDTGLLLWVHTSNYVVRGFTKEVPLKDLVELGRRKRLPVMADLGSGALLDLTQKQLPGEVTAQEVVRTGVSVVTFSGDKLLGGPQAGVILGRKRLLQKIKTNPIYRTVRCDKLTLALMEETLRTYRTHTVTDANLTLELLSTPREVLRRRAEEIRSALTAEKREQLGLSIVESTVEAGSGSLPEAPIESIALKLVPRDRRVTVLARQLRTGIVPVVGYTSGRAFYIDLKAILPAQIPTLIEALERV